MTDDTPEISPITRPEDKTCRGCSKSLPLSEFHRAEGLLGRSARCRHCHAEKDAADYWADPEAARAKARARRSANIDAYRQHGLKSYRKRRPDVLAKKKKKYHADLEAFRKQSRDYRRAKPWVSLIGKARVRAEKAGLAFNLDTEWAASQWTGVCAVTGAPFQPERGKRWAASIDRIVPALGYVQANCRFILWSVNTFKSDGDDAGMIEIARLIVEKASGR